MFLRNARNMFVRDGIVELAFIIVHFQKKEWVESGGSRHVPARVYFTEDCELQEIVPNPEWCSEEG